MPPTVENYLADCGLELHLYWVVTLEGIVVLGLERM